MKVLERRRRTLTHPHCDTTIVGTAVTEHLKENVAAALKGKLPQKLYDEVKARVRKAAGA